MSIVKEYSIKSVSGLADIYFRSWTPDGEPKAIIQIAHGMCEHSGIYGWICNKLCDAGFVVFMNDHLGHGKSVSDDSMLGYFGDGEGWLDIIKDFRNITEIAKQEHPDLPVIIMGHSMGSFIARAYTEMYKDADGAIYLGTAGAQPVDAGIMVANLVAKLHGKMHRSKLIEAVSFGTYNMRFEKRTPFDWLAKNKDFVDLYMADKYCGFRFTAYGYRDLFRLLKYISSPSWFENLPKDLPVLMLAGDMDPVGAFGKGVMKVYDKLKETGHTNVECRLFKDDRHVILEEADKEEAAAEIINFADKIAKVKAVK